MLNFVIIFITALVATTLSAMSGGGSSVIIVPVMLSLGISFPLAISVLKISAVFWVAIAAYNYLKGRKVEWGFILLFTAVGLIGLYFGTLVVATINQRMAELIIGILILILVTYLYFQKDVGLSETKIYSKRRKAIAYLFSPFIGFYEAILGSGNGILFSIITFKTRGYDFIDALGAYYVISFFSDIFVSYILIQKGYFSWPILIPTLIGSVIGAYLGSRYAKYKGNRFIKIVFIIIGTLLGLKLLFGF